MLAFQVHIDIYLHAFNLQDIARGNKYTVRQSRIHAVNTSIQPLSRTQQFMAQATEKYLLRHEELLAYHPNIHQSNHPQSLGHKVQK